MANFDHLLVTTDFSDQALPGVEAARDLAERLGSKTTLLYVVEDRMPPFADVETVLPEHRVKAAQSLTAYAAEHLPGAATGVRAGSPHEEIVAAAKDMRADLIVMATHGYGHVGTIVFGSTAERVVHHAPCPVLLVRSRT